ncbi:MAG: hypothetical protein KDC78_11720 [Aequorivita sp.]|nr:hypothetical protein [Aequorivita sp.]
MKIKSNAGSSELTSPFYKINEEFCRQFENYIAIKNGKVKGNYNAWSYYIQGEIMAPKPWHLKYKKATYTSTGNLILSSKKQNLLTLAEWSTSWIGAQNSEFEIRRKDSLGLMEILFNKLKRYQFSKNYLTKGVENNTSLIQNLHQKLESRFASKELYAIILKNDDLIISLRTEKHHFNFFEKLLNL